MSSFEAELQAVTELISLPEVYLKINQLIDDPTSDIDDFARVIHLDSNLSAKLLRAVNSVYYGFSGEVSSISRAVQLVGIQQLHVMVLSISAMTAVSSLEFPDDIVDFKAFWRSSLLTGTLARALARALKLQPVERFFILGLLHEIGHLVLYARFPDKARQVLQRVRDSGISANQAEMEVLGIHYGQVGARLMAQWKLPQAFQDLTRLQPVPEEAGDLQRESSLLHIAHAYANQHFLQLHDDVDELVHPVAWQSTGLSRDRVEEHLEDALASCLELERIILRQH